MGCSCSCHSTGAMHVMACCTLCPKCNKTVAIGTTCNCDKEENNE